MHSDFGLANGTMEALTGMAPASAAKPVSDR
jgi:hypothetical protein